MLYNPKWSTTPSLDGFIAWLETKDPSETYNWGNCNECAAGQYAKAIGFENWADQACQGTFLGKLMFQFSHYALISHSHTFGELLTTIKANRQAFQ